MAASVDRPGPHSPLRIASAGRQWQAKLGKRIPYVSGFLGVLAIWYVAALLINLRTVPSPIAVVRDFITMTYETPFVRSSIGTDSVLPHLLATAGRTVFGTLLGALSGILVGLLLGWKRNLQYFFELPIELLRTIPPLAYLPFLSLWFGPTNLAIFLLVYLGTFFMIVVNTVTAINNVDPIYAKFASTLGADEGHIYRTVIVPSIIPELTGGLRVIIVYSWGITVAGELLGVKRGIGQMLMALTTFAAVSEILATTIWVSLAAILFDRIYVYANNALIRWKEQFK